MQKSLNIRSLWVFSFDEFFLRMDCRIKCSCYAWYHSFFLLETRQTQNQSIQYHIFPSWKVLLVETFGLLYCYPVLCRKIEQKWFIELTPFLTHRHMHTPTLLDKYLSYEYIYICICIYIYIERERDRETERDREREREQSRWKKLHI